MKRIPRSLNEYKRMGALFRLVRVLLQALTDSVEPMVGVRNLKELASIKKGLEDLCYFWANELYEDYPQMDGTAYMMIFYGDLKRKPLNGLDAEIIDMAKSAAAGVFGDDSLSQDEGRDKHDTEIPV